MSELKYSVEHLLETRRCWKCGRYWAQENAKNSTECARCLEHRVHELEGENKHLEKSVVAYKGALTKARKRRKK